MNSQWCVERLRKVSRSSDEAIQRKLAKRPKNGSRGLCYWKRLFPFLFSLPGFPIIPFSSTVLRTFGMFSLYRLIRCSWNFPRFFYTSLGVHVSRFINERLVDVHLWQSVRPPILNEILVFGKFLSKYWSYRLETLIDSISHCYKPVYQISSRSLNSFLVFLFLAMSICGAPIQGMN